MHRQYLLLLGLLLSSPALFAAPTHGEVFKDWTTYCEKSSDDGSEEQCFSVQSISLNETGQRLLNFAVGHQAGTGQPVVILTLPLGISLPPGVLLQIDKGEPNRYQLERCDQNGCIAVFPLKEPLLKGLKRGVQAVVTFYDVTRQGIGVPVSLSGFTAGYRALDK